MMVVEENESICLWVVAHEQATKPSCSWPWGVRKLHERKQRTVSGKARGYLAAQLTIHQWPSVSRIKHGYAFTISRCIIHHQPWLGLPLCPCMSLRSRMIFHYHQPYIYWVDRVKWPITIMNHVSWTLLINQPYQFTQPLLSITVICSTIQCHIINVISLTLSMNYEPIVITTSVHYIPLLLDLLSHYYPFLLDHNHYYPLYSIVVTSLSPS